MCGNNLTGRFAAPRPFLMVYGKVARPGAWENVVGQTQRLSLQKICITILLLECIERISVSSVCTLRHCFKKRTVKCQNVKSQLTRFPNISPGSKFAKSFFLHPYQWKVDFTVFKNDLNYNNRNNKINNVLKLWDEVMLKHHNYSTLLKHMIRPTQD